MPSDKILRAALIGCGTVAEVHLTALDENENAEICALCDIEKKNAEAAMLRHSLKCRIYTDYIQMLNEVRPDIVHICTPHYLHSEMACAALQRNINVFLEKPAAMTLEQLQELKAAEKKSKAKLCVCFQNRFNPSTVRAQQLIGKYGPITQGFGCVRWKRDIPYYTESPWRGKWATEGGGVMINQAIHTLDLLIQFMGDVDSVTATCSNHHLKDIIEVEDTCEAMIDFKNGSRGLFYASTAALKDSQIELQFICKEHEIRIIGSNVYLDGEIYTGDDDTSDFTSPSEHRILVKECYGSSHIALIKMFYEAVAEDLPIPVTLDSASGAVEVLLAAYRSKDSVVKL